jgi:hypothetical protein
MKSKWLAGKQDMGILAEAVIERSRDGISGNPLKLTIAFREGADMSAASEQFACPAGDKRSLLKSGVQSGGWIPTNLRKRIVTGALGIRRYQLFDHYA